MWCKTATFWKSGTASYVIIVNMEKGLAHATLEQEIKRLSVEIKERGIAKTEQEAAKTIIKERIAAQTAGAETAAPAAPAADASSQILPQYLSGAPADVKIKVEKLLDMAWHSGIKRAAKEAKESGPLALDAFHDALTDKLYEEMKTRGLL